jgi:hypothetical protein
MTPRERRWRIFNLVLEWFLFVVVGTAIGGMVYLVAVSP